MTDRPILFSAPMVRALLNGAGSWDLNPWVWVVEFKRVGQ